MLNELDKELQQRGHSFVRYADDCSIYVRSEKAANRINASITNYIETKLKLKVNKENTGKSKVILGLATTITGKQNIRQNYSDKPPYTRPVRTVV